MRPMQESALMSGSSQVIEKNGHYAIGPLNSGQMTTSSDHVVPSRSVAPAYLRTHLRQNTRVGVVVGESGAVTLNRHSVDRPTLEQRHQPCFVFIGRLHRAHERADHGLHRDLASIGRVRGWYGGDF